MRTQKRKVILVGVLIAASLTFKNSSAQTLQTAIEAAIANEPRLAAMRANTEIEEAKLLGARAADKSSFSVYGSYGASNSDFGGGYKNIYPRALSLAWEKRIFDGGAALSRIEASQFSLTARNAEYINARNGLIVETAEAYLGLNTALKARDYAKEALATAQRMARDSGLQFNAGEVAIDEKALAEAALHRAEAALANANSQIIVAGANLYRLSGIKFVEANQSLDTNLRPLNIPATKDQALAIARESHPIILSSKAQLAAQEAQLRIANSARMPNISISARANTVRDQFLAGYKSDDVGAYINFSMPLWDNGRASSAQQSARAGLAAARANLRAIEREIEMGVTAAYANYEAQKAASQAAKASMDAVQIAHKSIEAQMRVGERPISDVLEAQARLTAAQLEHTRVNSALIIARYKIIQAIGAEF